MHDLLAEALHAVRWPRETSASFEISPDCAVFHVDVDLPESDHLPTQAAELAARGLKLSLHEHSDAQMRMAYAVHIPPSCFESSGRHSPRCPP
jgi:hypothetical protein